MIPESYKIQTPDGCHNCIYSMPYCQMWHCNIEGDAPISGSTEVFANWCHTVRVEDLGYCNEWRKKWISTKELMRIKESSLLQG